MKDNLNLLLKRRDRLVKELEELDYLIVNGKNKPKEPTPYEWFIYVLQCEDDCFYIGITTDVQKRFKRHKRGSGSWFTIEHKPISILDSWSLGMMVDSEATQHENKLAANYISRFGSDKVRGGCFIQRDSKHFEQLLKTWL